MVSKFIQPDMTAQDAASYKANIDGSIAVLAQMGAGFAPRAQDTPDMTLRVDPGALFNRGSGGFIAADGQNTATIVAPASNSKIVRVYVTESGVVGTVEGTASATPIAPSYPAGCFPIAQITVASTTTALTNALIIDERAFNTGYGTPRNTFLITQSSTFTCPAAVKLLRITAVGGGGGGGGGYSTASDAAKYGGGGGGGGASVIARIFLPENLTVVIGAGGAGGSNATAAAGNTAVAGSAGGDTTITGVSTNSITCAGGGGGGRAVSTPAVGAAGAAGAAGTGVAGSAGGAGTTTKGGNGGGTGTGATMSSGGIGGAWATTGRSGTLGVRGSGGGGGSGFSVTGGGANGGDGFVLIEVF